MKTRLRHVVQVNPLSRRFDRLADDAVVPFLPMENVWPGDKLDLSLVQPKSAVVSGYTRFQSGDVVVPKITPTFEASRSALIPSLPDLVGAGTTELHVVRPGSEIEPRYLLYVFHSHDFLKLGEAEMYGVAGQKRVPDDFLRDWVIDLPSFDEQRRIADFLDAETARIDALAALSQRMREILVLKRERMVELILGLDASPAMQPLKYAVQSVSVGIVITPAKWYVDNGGVAALRGLNVQPGRIDTSKMVQISDAGHRENMKSRLSLGDVVVVRTGQAGVAAIVPEELDGSNCIDLLIIRPGAQTSSSFLAHYLNSFYALGKISEHSVGSIQSHFNVGSMENLDFPILERPEQERRAASLDEVVGDLDLLDSWLETQLALLAERRQGFVTAAVTGKIDISTARRFSLSVGGSA